MFVVGADLFVVGADYVLAMTFLVDCYTNGQVQMKTHHYVKLHVYLKKRAKRRCAFAVTDAASLGENVLNDPDPTNNNTEEESSSTSRSTRTPAHEQTNLRSSATAALSSIFSSLDTNNQKMQRRGAVTALIPLDELEGLGSSEDDGESDFNMRTSSSNNHQHLQHHEQHAQDQKKMAHSQSELPQSSPSSFLQQQQQQQSSFGSAQFDNAFHNSAFANSILVNNDNNNNNRNEWKDQTMDAHHSFSTDQQQHHDQQKQHQQHLNHQQQAQLALQPTPPQIKPRCAVLFPTGGEGDESNNSCDNNSSQIQVAANFKHRFSQQLQQRNHDNASSDDEDDDDSHDGFHVKCKKMRRRGVFFTTTKPAATMDDEVCDDDNSQHLDHDVQIDAPIEGSAIDETL